MKIGDFIRLHYWTTCMLQVMDIGTYSIIGTLVDVKTDKVIVPIFLAPVDEEWIIVPTAKELIDSL